MLLRAIVALIKHVDDCPPPHILLKKTKKANNKMRTDNSDSSSLCTFTQLASSLSIYFAHESSNWQFSGNGLYL